MQFLIDEGRISSNCKTGGISLQPNEGMGQGTSFEEGSLD